METSLDTLKPQPEEFVPEVAPVSEFERDIALLLRAKNRDVFRLLGPHISEEGEEKRLVVRGFFPRASEAFVLLK